MQSTIIVSSESCYRCYHLVIPHHRYHIIIIAYFPMLFLFLFRIADHKLIMMITTTTMMMMMMVVVVWW